MHRFQCQKSDIPKVLKVQALQKNLFGHKHNKIVAKFTKDIHVI